MSNGGVTHERVIVAALLAAITWALLGAQASLAVPAVLVALPVIVSSVEGQLRD